MTRAHWPGLALTSLRRDPLTFLAKAAARGDLVRIGPSFHPVFFANHPTFIRHVLQEHCANYPKRPAALRVRPLFGDGLTTADGERWHQTRRALLPLFQPGRMQGFASCVTDAAAKLDARWSALAASGRRVDIGTEMLALTREVIVRVLFGEVPSEQVTALSAAMEEALEEVNHRVWSLFVPPLWIPTPANRRLRSAVYTLHQFVHGRIEEARKRGRNPSSLLDALLDLEDAPADDAWLRDEVMTVLFAGHTTAAAALAWTWLLLDAHSQSDQILVAELQRVLIGRAPSAADIPALPYLRMVIEETLRLYPPTWITARTARAEDHMGAQRIPAGSLLLLSPWAAHRHPAFWPDAECFDPERFAPVGRDQRTSFTYLPFGAGPRACVGQGFAMMEMILILAALACRYRVRLASPGPIMPEPTIVLRPPRGTLVQIERRSGSGGNGP